MKPTKRSVTKKLDKIFSEIVRSIGKCQNCPKTEPLNSAHIFSRANRSVRWSFLNSICLCVKCHFYFHQNPLLFAIFVKDELGEEKYNELVVKARTIKKWTLDEMLELYEELKKMKTNLK